MTLKEFRHETVVISAPVLLGFAVTAFCVGIIMVIIWL